MQNLHSSTVESFGDEWCRFDQVRMSQEEAEKVFTEYFAVFPWAVLPKDAEGFDMGCGSDRWARMVAPRVGRLHCIDPSKAIEVAERILGNFDNVVFHKNSVDSTGLQTASQDFGYSLGVLHHVPDTAAAIRSCAELLKPGAPLLLYIYYAFDNRSVWFQALWRLSDLIRQLICCLTSALKHLVTDAIATLVYWPLARLSRLLTGLGLNVHSRP